MKLFSSLPQCSTTAEKKILKKSHLWQFMFNSHRRQAGVLQYFLVTFDKLCSITEKWPLGIKKNLSCHSVSASSNIFLPSESRNCFSTETIYVFFPRQASMRGSEGLNTSVVVYICSQINHRTGWNFVHALSTCGRKLLSNVHQHPLEENLIGNCGL